MHQRLRGLDRKTRGALIAAGLAGAFGAAPSLAALGGCAQIAGLTDHEAYPPNGIVQVSAGFDHACALTRSGNVWCWGANDTGQLGRACTTPACPAGQVVGLSGMAQISAGAGFTCAVGSGGKVQCWGKNASGELGRATLGTCGTGIPCEASPGAVQGLTGAVQVSAGGGYACARTTTGTVSCWGDNAYGELGTGDFMPSGAAGATRPALGVTQAVDVSAGLTGASTCVATSSGTVFCWGLDVNGAVGRAPAATDPKSSDNQPCVVTPVAVAGVAGAVAVRAGDQAGCAEIMSGTTSSFSCWGYDGLGCLGGASMANVGLPPAAVTVVPRLAALDLRDTNACGVDLAGNAWCWGQSGYGALGPEAALAADCDATTPCQRKAIEVGRASVAQIATGGNLSLALLTDGTIWAWGQNDDGRLGHPPGTLKDAPCLANNKAICNGTPNPVQGLPQ